MKKQAKAAQKEECRSFTQEMHLAFTEWLSSLPFIKKDAPKAPAGETQEDIPKKTD